MELTPLNAKVKNTSKKSEVKEIRRQGGAPATYYGQGKEAQSLEINAHEFGRIYKAGQRNTLFDLKMEGQEGENAAIVYGVQVDPIKANVLHVDFLAVKKGEPVKVSIPVNFIGTPVGVKTEGGSFLQQFRNIKVLVAPENIPASIDIDISDCVSDFSYYMRDVKLPEGCTLASSIKSVLFTIQKGRGQ